jgi:tetratricopeptide (TPR) repeat protein
MIGLRSGNWKFTIQAPGFSTFEGTAGIRAGTLSPISVQLVKDLGPLPGALDSNIQRQLASANALRDEGRLDQAIAAYQEIRSKNPKLTALHLVIGNAYRTRADKEQDPAARRTYLDRAIESFSEAVKAEAGGDRARQELASAQAAVAAPSR